MKTKTHQEEIVKAISKNSNQLDLFSQEKKTISVIVYCGYEGIEELVYASSNEQEVVNKMIELKHKAHLIKEEAEKYTEDQRDEMLDSEDPAIKEKAKIFLFRKDPDAYCVQSFDGEKFKCTCQEFGVSPDKPWLY